MSKYVCIDELEPEMYNNEGYRMRLLFLRDVHSMCMPHTGGSPRILWDRCNVNLKTHVYTHLYMAEPQGKPVKKFGMFIESEAIVPQDYEWLLNNPGIADDFDAIFTFSERLLDRFPTARFIPGGGAWYGTIFGGELREDAYLHKTKNVSMIASDKTLCPMHLWRNILARIIKRSGLGDTYGTFAGGEYCPSKAVALDDYRYSVAVENFIGPYYFTEKLLDCFASMTVPIYVGASKISNFFNPDGIIQLNMRDVPNIDKILAQCSEKDYESRLEAIKDNYRRLVQSYHDASYYLYDHYFGVGERRTFA